MKNASKEQVREELRKKETKRAGVELNHAQVKLEVIVEVLFQLPVRVGGCGWSDKTISMLKSTQSCG